MTVWIFSYRGLVLEIEVGPNDVITKADSPMEWCVGEPWEPVRRLFEVLGSLSPKDPPP